MGGLKLYNNSSEYESPDKLSNLKYDSEKKARFQLEYDYTFS